MNKTDIAKNLAQKAGITKRFADYLLSGGRKASPSMAKHLENVMGIDRRCWVWPEDFPNPLIENSNG